MVLTNGEGHAEVMEEVTGQLCWNISSAMQVWGQEQRAEGPRVGPKRWLDQGKESWKSLQPAGSWHELQLGEPR